MTSIHETYRIRALQIAKSIGAKDILKTDCWNEAEGDFPIANELGARCIEINEDRIKKAMKRFPELIIDQGDIRSLPYQDASFDLVIDLSTIDHVAEYGDALKEYRRILRPDGTLFVVVWTSTLESDKIPEEDAWGGKQYRFRNDEFIKAIPFKNIETGVFDGFDREDRQLRWFKTND